jgi:hypothetical protein
LRVLMRNNERIATKVRPLYASICFCWRSRFVLSSTVAHLVGDPLLTLASRYHP